MKLVSSNLVNYIPHEKDYVYRINMAWRNSVAEIEKDLVNIHHLNAQIFLDHPKGRKKPPNNDFCVGDILDLCKFSFSIRYVAISNVESSADVKPYLVLPPIVQLVYKIETIIGIKNIANIKPRPKMVMLDHDDLCTCLVHNQIDPAGLYTDYIDPFLAECKELDIKVLRTRGVFFSDE